jgi:hypothetical protein
MIPVLIVVTGWMAGSVGYSPTGGGHIPGSIALAHLGSHGERSATSQGAMPQGHRDCTPEVFGRIYARSAAACQPGRPLTTNRVT